MHRTLRKILFFTLFGLLGTGNAHATKLVHRNAAELTSMAARIFVGQCVTIEQKTMSVSGFEISLTEYTFSVSQALKGVAGGNVVFRQFGAIQGNGSIIGMPSYEQGKQYLLFLGKDSELGLTSPIGFGQGAFLIFTDNNGDTQAMNAFGNRGLFDRMSPSQPVLAKASLNLSEQKMLQKTSGPLALGNLLSFVTKMIE